LNEQQKELEQAIVDTFLEDVQQFSSIILPGRMWSLIASTLAIPVQRKGILRKREEIHDFQGKDA